MKRLLCLLSFLLLANLSVFAADWERLCKDGYRVIEKTSIYGEFNGCEYGKYYKLSNGLTFKCEEYEYMYEYNPDVFILQNNYGRLKVIIGNEEIDGSLYR